MSSPLNRRGPGWAPATFGSEVAVRSVAATFFVMRGRSRSTSRRVGSRLQRVLGVRLRCSELAATRMVPYHLLAPLNSLLNATAAILLLAGFYCIRQRRVRAHRMFMLSAVMVSAAFFISYCVYHYHVGDVRFEGRGWVRPVYFTILISHVSLAAAIVPLVLVTLWRALSRNFRQHQQIARWTWPIWIYVSITGVVVYLMCYQLYSPGYSPSAAATVQVPIGASAARTARVLLKKTSDSSLRNREPPRPTVAVAGR